MKRNPIETTRRRSSPIVLIGRWLILAVCAGLALSAGLHLFSSSLQADEQDTPQPKKKVHTGSTDTSRGRKAGIATSNPTTHLGRRVINSGRGQMPLRPNIKSPSVGARRRSSTTQPANTRTVDTARNRRAAQARRAAAARRRSDRLSKSRQARGRRVNGLRFSEVRSAPIQDEINYGVDDIIESQAGKQYRLRYKFDPQQTLYLVLQNEFIDRGGVPGLMTFKSTARDRITIVQTMATAEGAPGTPGGARRFNRVNWQVDRFQIEENLMDKVAVFDSIKDLYPVGKLRKLGRIPGSKIEFDQNGWTGEFKNVNVRYGNDRVGPASREKLSRTSQRADIEPENMQRLLDDLGTLILPRQPVAVGDQWQRERRSDIRNFGASVTRYDLTLQDVSNDGDDLIARVRIAGEITLERADDAADNDSADNAATGTTDDGVNGKAMKAPRQQDKSDADGKDFKLDRAAVEGDFRFNITQGRLVELNLRRVREMSADMETEAMGPMSLESGESHTLRVTISTTEPIKPIIVGGPKAPDEPEPEPPANRRVANRPTTQQLEKQREAREAAQRRREERREKAQQSLQDRLQAAREARERATSRPSENSDDETGQPQDRRPITRPPATTQPASE